MPRLNEEINIITDEFQGDDVTVAFELSAFPEESTVLCTAGTSSSSFTYRTSQCSFNGRTITLPEAPPSTRVLFVRYWEKLK